MELKKFISETISDVIGAIEEANKQSHYEMHIAHSTNNTGIEFDIALTVNDATTSGGKIGVSVAQFFDGSGEKSKELRNTSESRIKFGVYISTETKDVIAEQRAEIKRHGIR